MYDSVLSHICIKKNNINFFLIITIKKSFKEIITTLTTKN